MSESVQLDIKTVNIKIPKEANIIIGQSHFIKTIEDIYEALVNSVPNILFGLAFCESSGPCLVRHIGNDPELEKKASENALSIAAGHSFIIFIKNAYPINVLNAIKNVSEVCNIYCATANPTQIILAETDMGRSILGVVDGFRSKSIENEEDIGERKKFLRRIGYKL